MTETQGWIAGLFLLFACLVYTFWPETSSQPAQKTQLDYLLERKTSSTKTSAISTSSSRRQVSEEDFNVCSAHSLKTRPPTPAEIDHLHQHDLSQKSETE